MRGKPNAETLPAGRDRITPADAGKTEQGNAISWNARDHPRGCGENLLHCVRAIAGIGSPPRMRGKREDGRKYGKKNGITPADAGKTAMLSRQNVNAWDHPRGCGENLLPAEV